MTFLEFQTCCYSVILQVIAIWCYFACYVFILIIDILNRYVIDNNNNDNNSDNNNTNIDMYKTDHNNHTHNYRL